MLKKISRKISRKIFIPIVFAVLFVIVAVPFLATAATTTTAPVTASIPPDKFTLTSCQKVITDMGYEFKPEYFDEANSICYAPKAPYVSLAFPFPGLLSKQSTSSKFPGQYQVSWGDYVSEAYKYGFVAAIALAILMIIIGGAMWIIGGAMETQKTAKDLITQSLIGIAILAAAYLLLNTINPKLTNLDFPGIPTVQPVNLQSVCSCSGTKQAGQFCESASECEPGLACFDMTEMLSAQGNVAFAMTALVSAAGVGATADVLEGAASSDLVKSLINYTAKGGYQVLKIGGKNLIMNPVKAYGAYKAIVYLAETPINIGCCTADQIKKVKGICTQEAQGSLPDNAICAQDSNCISGKCLCTKDAGSTKCAISVIADPITTTVSLLKNNGLFIATMGVAPAAGLSKTDLGLATGGTGLCTSPKAGNACLTDDDCKSSTEELKCMTAHESLVTGETKYCTSQTNRTQGTTCQTSADCGVGLLCDPESSGNVCRPFNSWGCQPGFHNDCPDGFVCQDDSCIATNPNIDSSYAIGTPCAGDKNCAEGLNCEGSLTRCSKQCTNDSNCTPCQKDNGCECTASAGQNYGLCTLKE